MFEQTLQTSMLYFAMIGIAWPQEALPPQDPQGEGGHVTMHIYGRAEEPVGQSLTASLRPGRDTEVLWIEGAEAGDHAWAIIGTKPAHFPLPWGDALRVSPDLIVDLGRFDQQGAVAISLNSHDPALIGTNLFVQVIEELAIDPYEWPIQTTPGIQLTYDGPPVAEGTGGGPVSVDPADLQDHAVQIDAVMLVIDGPSPRWVVQLEAVVPSEGYQLVLDKMLRVDGGEVTVRATLVRPAPGSSPAPGQKVVRLNVDIGGDGWCLTRVLVSRVDEGVHYIVHPPYELISSFRLGGC